MTLRERWDALMRLYERVQSEYADSDAIVGLPKRRLGAAPEPVDSAHSDRAHQ